MPLLIILIIVSLLFFLGRKGRDSPKGTQEKTDELITVILPTIESGGKDA